MYQPEWMKPSVELSFRHVEPSDALREVIEKELQLFEECFSGLFRRCRVSVEYTHRHYIVGSPFVARVELTVRGKDPLIIRRFDDDAYMAVTEALAIARKSLQKNLDRRRTLGRHTPGPRWPYAA
jgi:ribosome-associated translation inhibitor RaiA